MTQTFKVGDKVVNDVFGPGEIVYGPFNEAGGRATYFFKGEDGLHHTVSEGYCKLVQKFKIGDKVKSYGEEYTIHARSEEHTSELQSREKLVCRLLLDNKN